MIHEWDRDDSPPPKSDARIARESRRKKKQAATIRAVRAYKKKRHSELSNSAIKQILKEK